MFRRREEPTLPIIPQSAPTERVTSVLGPGIAWKGDLNGSGGIRIEGAFEGNIGLRGLLVVGETGRVTCEHLRANVIIIAGAVKGDITAERVEIRATGRVWGDVVTAAFATEEGAFLRGQITMEEKVEIGIGDSSPAAGQLKESGENLVLPAQQNTDTDKNQS
jgi:cytoskeletal protein CcmA (bactofilin family)